ncbi:hypothetical protein LTR53_000633 [Teratosphaeriaceae sp. CCFEE 6253]|nr:hypothetical protein LTR53_000633 [Teratosphaeriaceae sp. CCFEE 6253]
MAFATSDRHSWTARKYIDTCTSTRSTPALSLPHTRAVSMSETRKPWPELMGLPAEVRVQIYQALLPEARLIFHIDTNYSYTFSPRADSLMHHVNKTALISMRAISTVSRQVRDESRSILDRAAESIEYQLYHGTTNISSTITRLFYTMLPRVACIKIVDHPFGWQTSPRWGSLLDLEREQIHLARIGQPKKMAMLERQLTLRLIPDAKVGKDGPRGWTLETRVGRQKTAATSMRWKVASRYSAMIYAQMAQTHIAGGFDGLFLHHFLAMTARWDGLIMQFD